MPDITTETIQRHTIVVTDDELTALRSAAQIALSHALDHEHRERWHALRRLGLPATRSSDVALHVEGTIPPGLVRRVTRNEDRTAAP